MADEEKLSSALESFAMLKCPFFISSFPSYVIFGKTIRNEKYSSGEFFKIKFSDAYKLMVNLLYIGSFLTANDITNSRGLIIENEEDSENYFWHGITIQKNEEEIKVVKFGIETLGNITFNVVFSVEEINNLIYLFKRCLITCLCLKEHEQDLLLTIANTESCENIVAAKTNTGLAKTLVNQFYRSSNHIQPENCSFLVELIFYYNDIILIVKQLSALYTPSEDNSAIILALQ
jgi:hypothetical protein